MQYDEAKNAIPGNENWRNHISYVFDHVLDQLVSQEAELDVIGLENGGLGVMEYLASHWSKWDGRIAGICLSQPQNHIDDLTNETNTALTDFVTRRCRGYLVSDAELETPIVEITRRNQLLSSEVGAITECRSKTHKMLTSEWSRT